MAKKVKKAKKVGWTPTKFNLWAAISGNNRMVANTLGLSRKTCKELTEAKNKDHPSQIPPPVAYVTVTLQIDNTPANRKRLGVKRA